MISANSIRIFSCEKMSQQIVVKRNILVKMKDLKGHRHYT